ncbi:MAG: hypothetical protein JSW50_11185 [Candidatus Latescibacterota bacterium]|nr:MAG: hypothetical protein JSW50_11185 [Candidatus Latescibacterota bacterium]
MKTTSRRWGTIITFVVGVAALAGFLVGCSDDDERLDIGPEPSAITVEQLIFNPKSPAPGDTMQATAVVTASTQNIGDFVSYSWSNSGGTLIENNLSSVRWVAPTNSGVFTLTCTASNSVNSSTESENVFVGSLLDLITSRAGEMYPRTDNTMIYLSPPADADSGVIVRQLDLTTGEDVVVFPAEEKAGSQYSFDAEAQHAGHMLVERAFQQKLTVVYDDIAGGIQTVIARDPRPFSPEVTRPNEFSSPYVAHDGTGLTYQGSLLDQEATPAQGGVDTFAVYIYDIVASTTQRATFVGDNFYPSFSSDANYLVYIANHEGTFEWEFYSLPLDNMVAKADTSAGKLVKLTDSGGLFGSESIPPEPVPFLWNPQPGTPVLAALATDDRIWLINPAGGDGTPVDIPGRIVDGVWSNDGQTLAVSSFDGDASRASIHLVNLSGGATLLYQALERDRIGLLTWSPEDTYLVYTVDRSGEIWYELYDVEGSTGLTKPARITPAWVPGFAVDYGSPLMTLRSSWMRMPGSVTAYLFFLDQDTPRVMSLDLSGI